MCEASAICGYSLREPNNFKTYLVDAGFEDTVEVRYKIPTAPWPKDQRMKLIGAFEMQSLLQELRHSLLGRSQRRMAGRRRIRSFSLRI